MHTRPEALHPHPCSGNQWLREGNEREWKGDCYVGMFVCVQMQPTRCWLDGDDGFSRGTESGPMNEKGA